MTLGERIRAARKHAGLTQKELATDSALSLITIRRYENNERVPKVSECLRIADALHIFGEAEQRAFIYGESDAEAANRLFSTVTGEKPSDEPPISTIDQRIAASLMKLNELGQEEAARRVEELTEISRYKNPDYEEQDSP